MIYDEQQKPPQKLPALLTGYGLAVVSIALASLARWLLPSALTPAPYLGFYPAVRTGQPLRYMLDAGESQH